MTYLFRDTDLAARRLEVLAEVFGPASRAFVAGTLSEVSRTPGLALDLGCGPGHTTQMLWEASGSRRAVGLDASAHFIALARARYQQPALSFSEHDLTQIPFPDGVGDLLFCRMLLTHLRDPLSVLDNWATQLRPGGLLLVDEVEEIQTSHPVFQRYLRIVAETLGQQANQLYIGSVLDQQRPPRSLRRISSRVAHFAVPTRQAASMFVLNVPAWKQNPYVLASYGDSEIERLERELQELAEYATATDEIMWGMRQVAWQS